MTVMATASDREGELVERGSDPELFPEGVNAEFVVPAAKVLHERVTADHHACRPLGLQTTHWAKARFQSAVIAIDAVVRVRPRVVLGVGEHIFDCTDQRLGLVGGDLLRPSVFTEDTTEEPAGPGPVTAGRDEDVDHLGRADRRPGTRTATRT